MKYLLLFFSFVCLSTITFAQERVIRGKVTDDTGTPLQGVSVIPKGSKTGTQTDKDGNFTINVPGTGSTELSFSCSVSSTYKYVMILEIRISSKYFFLPVDERNVLIYVQCVPGKSISIKKTGCIGTANKFTSFILPCNKVIRSQYIHCFWQMTETKSSIITYLCFTRST